MVGSSKLLLPGIVVLTLVVGSEGWKLQAGSAFRQSVWPGDVLDARGNYTTYSSPQQTIPIQAVSYVTTSALHTSKTPSLLTTASGLVLATTPDCVSTSRNYK